MPPKMKDALESDPSWRNFASAIEAGSDELWQVFDRCATIRAWTQAGGTVPPFPEAWITNSMTSDAKDRLCNEWKKQEQEMTTWLKANDSNYGISEAGKSSEDPISRGLAYWNTICLLARNGPVNLDNYISIARARKLGIVALPNDLGSTPPKQ